MEDKKEAIFRKLDKRHEDHQAAKEIRKSEENPESKETLKSLLAQIVQLQSEIEDEINKSDKENAGKILETYSDKIGNLESFFTEKSSILTAFDTRKVQGSILEIRNQFQNLQDSLRPKKKFGFKSDKKKNFQKKSSETEKILDEKKIQMESGFNLRNRENETIEIEDAQILNQDVMLSNLKNCTVSFKANPITLHATNLTNCVLKCAPVQTSIYLENCNFCTLSLACQQLRAHNSKDSKIYLHVTSKGIIEDCQGIQVAPYDLDYSGIEEQFEKLGLDIKINHWNQLDDFNWLASDQPSPNWSVMK